MSATAEAALALVVAVGVGLLAWAYRPLWRLLAPNRTPSGFGLFLAPVMLGAAWLCGASPPLILSLGVATLGTCLYWLDDIVELSATVRVGICIAAGAGAASFFTVATHHSLPIIILLAMLAAFVSVVMVNLVNFQDGADLNLAVFIALSAALLLGYAPPGSEWVPVAVSCLAFVLPFALINRRPRALYLGDAGSFAFGILLTILGTAFVVVPGDVPPEAALAIGLPLVDTIYVTAHRIRIRHRFTTRHYFHLYQRLQRDHRGFHYLLPQFANVALSLLGVLALRGAGLDRTWSVILASAIVSTLCFIACHRLFVTGEPGPADRNRAAA